jgi:hypothetical protein
MADGDGVVFMPCGSRESTRDSGPRISRVSDSEAGMRGGGCFVRGAGRLSCAMKGSVKELAAIEPFVDEAEAERLDKEAKLMQFLGVTRRQMEHRKRMLAAEEKIRDFDPKQEGEYFTRFHYIDLTTFDLDEECKSIRSLSVQF